MKKITIILLFILSANFFSSVYTAATIDFKHDNEETSDSKKTTVASEETSDSKKTTVASEETSD
ncbi:hypothetical protein, partial [Vagococcus xieshaowenii]